MSSEAPTANPNDWRAVTHYADRDVNPTDVSDSLVYFWTSDSKYLVFLRDTNALAGDNLSQAPAPNEGSTYQSGFPIFYDAKVTELNVSATPETGFGLGGG